MKRAFTILEILVVLSVIAVLVGIAVPKFKGMQDEAKVTQVKRELKTLQAAVESYSMNANPKAYPPTSAMVCADSLISAVPQIISRVLHDPFGGTADSEYNYILSDNGRYYTLCSAGPDRASETSAVVDDGVVALGGDDLCVTNGTIGSGGGGPGCSAGQADCGSGCQDILSDVSNCSACGNVCSVSQICSVGRCIGVGPRAIGQNCSRGGLCQSGYCNRRHTVCSDGSDGSSCYNGVDCQSGKCEDFVCSNQVGAVGTGCYTASSCQDGYCSQAHGLCTDGSNGSGCGNPTDCQSGYCVGFTCSALPGVVGANCWGGGASCQSGYCVNQFCSATPGAIGAWCREAASCQSGYCNTDMAQCAVGLNGSGCWVGSVCPSGYCVNRACSAQPGVLGDLCTDSASCQSGYCVNWKCSTQAGGPGDLCNDGVSCQSGNCVEGDCF